MEYDTFWGISRSSGNRLCVGGSNCNIRKTFGVLQEFVRSQLMVTINTPSSNVMSANFEREVLS
jgi:hypothetical protein